MEPALKNETQKNYPQSIEGSLNSLQKSVIDLYLQNLKFHHTVDHPAAYIRLFRLPGKLK
jgi:hypothetical protein